MTLYWLFFLIFLCLFVLLDVINIIICIICWKRAETENQRIAHEERRCTERRKINAIFASLYSSASSFSPLRTLLVCIRIKVCRFIWGQGCCCCIYFTCWAWEEGTEDPTLLRYDSAIWRIFPDLRAPESWLSSAGRRTRKKRLPQRARRLLLFCEGRISNENPVAEEKDY